MSWYSLFNINTLIALYFLYFYWFMVLVYFPTESLQLLNVNQHIRTFQSYLICYLQIIWIFSHQKKPLKNSNILRLQLIRRRNSKCCLMSLWSSFLMQTSLITSLAHKIISVFISVLDSFLVITKMEY